MKSRGDQLDNWVRRRVKSWLWLPYAVQVECCRNQGTSLAGRIENEETEHKGGRQRWGGSVLQAHQAKNSFEDDRLGRCAQI